MKKPTHPIFRWPGSSTWLLPLVVSLLLFWVTGNSNTLWWYLVVPVFVALTLIDLFSTVWFGITTLLMLFLYCSIGSSGVPISYAIWEPQAWVNLREMRWFEMTEFEWFHWWPFKWLIAILCLNMFIVTVRKIKFTILTLGVWMIHTGVIVMVLGCLVYFSQKIEGDVLVSRRVVVIQIEGGKSTSMVVTPENTLTVGETSYTITDINPSWTLMSGDDKGAVAYAVTIKIERPHESFMRQIIAGYPEYTEDIVQSGNPEQPMARAKNVVGRALFDEDLVMTLEYDVKDTFYVTQSGALYIRELSEDGTPLTDWIERPIHNLPRFNDYLTGREDVWISGNSPGVHPLSLPVESVSSDDPIEQGIFIDSYLRYAFLDTQVIGGGDKLFPTAWVTLRKGEEAVQSAEMFAFDPSLNTADTSLMSFRWVENSADLEALRKSLTPAITATIAGATYTLDVADDTFQQVGSTEYYCKINTVQNNLTIGDLLVSLAIIELKHGDQVWNRWVFDNPAMNRDVIEGTNHENNEAKGATFIDTDITMTYRVGGAPITLVGGLVDDSYIMLTTIGGKELESTQLEMGQPVLLTAGVSLTLDRGEANTYQETRPMVIPPMQRDPGASNRYSMIRVAVSSEAKTVSTWLPYHHYPIESTKELVRRFQYKPTKVTLQDGKHVEMLFSRRSAKLPIPIALKRFEVDSHLGGFTGSTSSILNWRSIVKFLDGTGTEMAVSVNDPQSYDDFWFFQSQWDPPDGVSQGLNYTVLGVGNRHGVFQMLFGCCITVSGMIWAFYVKPMIKRKRQQAVCAEVSK